VRGSLPCMPDPAAGTLIHIELNFTEVFIITNRQSLSRSNIHRILWNKKVHDQGCSQARAVLGGALVMF
jgi:hypothetical protein